MIPEGEETGHQKIQGEEEIGHKKIPEEDKTGYKKIRREEETDHIVEIPGGKDLDLEVEIAEEEEPDHKVETQDLDLKEDKCLIGILEQEETDPNNGEAIRTQKKDGSITACNKPFTEKVHPQTPSIEG